MIAPICPQTQSFGKGDQQRSRLGDWLELLRAPNLPTAWGDPAAGWVLACMVGLRCSHPQAVWAALAGLCIYAAGLIQNDYFDQRIDKTERPGRPIVSGRIAPRVALGGWIILFIAGVGIASLNGVASVVFGVALVVTVTFYNRLAKKVVMLGPIVMGTCRAMSVLLGAGAAGPQALTNYVVLILAAGVGLYITTVSLIAINETRGVESLSLLGPPWAALIWLGIIGHVMPYAPSTHVAAAAVVLANAAFIGVLWTCWKMYRPRNRMHCPAGIGWLIRALPLMHASVAMMGGFVVLGVAFALMVPVSAILARWFHAS